MAIQAVALTQKTLDDLKVKTLELIQKEDKDIKKIKALIQFQNGIEAIYDYLPRLGRTPSAGYQKDVEQ